MAGRAHSLRRFPLEDRAICGRPYHEAEQRDLPGFLTRFCSALPSFLGTPSGLQAARADLKSRPKVSATLRGCP
jgi:hypothetical protein